MAKKISQIPFKGTPEQEAELLRIIDAHAAARGELMPILQEAQDVYGYLPIEVQTIIAKRMGIPLEEVYGIVTFYTQFSLEPKGKYNIMVCLGTACYVRGAGEILERMKERLGIEAGGCTIDGKFSLEACRCIGACGLAPVLMVNEEVYGRLTVDDVDRIVAKYE
ncbi:MAG: NAD(P)H-dependent oxidoreductase subunit E [Clostridiales bacterium]|nr:NAD(P)H-dependent oxidoreductase subunit E [Clostridiales bacterium]